MATYAMFQFQFDQELLEDEMWPDGDAPANWGLMDVVKLVEKCGGSKGILRDWDWIKELKCMVTVDDQSVLVP